MEKNRFSPFTALIIMALGLMTTGCVECVGDKSCEQAVREHWTGNGGYVERTWYDDTFDDGTFTVLHANKYGAGQSRVETDCNCKITYINGKRQN